LQVVLKVAAAFDTGMRSATLSVETASDNRRKELKSKVWFQRNNMLDIGSPILIGTQIALLVGFLITGIRFFRTHHKNSIGFQFSMAEDPEDSVI
jgi:hypothetical protein